jgi:hypothetical protein
MTEIGDGDPPQTRQLAWEQCTADPPSWRAQGRRWAYLLLTAPGGRTVLSRPGPAVSTTRQALMAAAYAITVPAADEGRRTAARFEAGEDIDGEAAWQQPSPATAT